MRAPLSVFSPPTRPLSRFAKWVHCDAHAETGDTHAISPVYFYFFLITTIRLTDKDRASRRGNHWIRRIDGAIGLYSGDRQCIPSTSNSHSIPGTHNNMGI